MFNWCVSVNIHVQVIYMFVALAIVCDDFFVSSLEKICEVRVYVFPTKREDYIPKNLEQLSFGIGREFLVFEI